MIAFVLIGTISELLNISSKQVSKLINSLKAKGYIDVTMKYKDNSKQIETRTIKTIQEKFNTSPSKVLYPYPTNGVDVTSTDSSKLQNAVINTGEITGGEGNKDVINNVYDLLGNRLEWTQEANSFWGARRVLRGGVYNIAYSLSFRNHCLPTYEGAYGGCRFTLYIK